MLVHANSSLKYERSAILPFYRRRWHQLSPRTSQRIACLPVCLETHDQVLPTIKKMASGGVLDAKQDLLLSSSYESAMEALSSLITRKRRGDKSNIGGKFGKLERMEKYLQILGLEDRLAGLKIIHVAGTKGKGSTCTFSEAILRECGFRTGLFTSPHLIDVRERFRVDGLDISEEIFLQYFWDCWHHLKENVSEDLPMPPLFQFLTILAFKIFICEQVDVAIIEVGLGGKRDSTNVIKEPVVCGIASLGMDHVETLGNTLGQIAAHKVGIFKPHIPGFTVPQLPEAMDVIKEKASELKVPLEVVPPLDPKQLTGLKLSLSGDHQYTNAALAVALCRCWLQRTTGPKDIFQNGQFVYLPEPFLRGLATARLSGRAQIFYDTPSRASNTSEMKESSSGDLVFYLDGAHSPESMEACARWFSNTVKEDMSYSSGNPKLQGPPQNGFVRSASGNFEGSEKSSKQILLFNCMEVRDPQALLPKLVDTCASSGVHFSKAFFVPSMSTYNKVTSASVISSDTAPKDLSWQLTLQKIWENITHGNDAVVDENSKAESRETLPSSTFLCRHPNNCNPEAENLTCSAVMPSLPSAIKWLRDSARENPSLRIQVLVTGSLHLVGDVLKLLKRG